jgi:hypothetical protein
MMKIKIDPLDQLFSRYIRLKAGIGKDGVGKCERCGHYNFLQCAHFHSRRKRTVRWDEENAAALCYGCHSYLDGNPMEKIEFFKKKIGEDRFIQLNIRAMQTHPKPDQEAIKIWLKQEIKKIE